MAAKKFNSETYVSKLSVEEGAKIYAQLRHDVTESGILDRDYTYYILVTIFTFLGLSFGIYLLYISNTFLPLVLSGLFFSFFGVQIAGLFHDAGHRAIFKSVRNNDIFGHISCAFIAYTFNKWKVNHNKHHANPNEEDMDPDIDRPMLSFNEKQFIGKKGLWRQIAKIQVFSYYPMSSFTAIYSQLANAFYFIREPKKSKTWEKAIYLAGIFGWLIAPFFVFGVIKALIIFMIVYPVMGFYLFNVFAPNHKGMYQIKKGQKISFLEQQIITSRNVTGGHIRDFIYLGLNWQIEHHLFPECPRNKLPKLRPFVKKICDEYGLSYTDVGIIETNRIILSELKEVTLSA